MPMGPPYIALIEYCIMSYHSSAVLWCWCGQRKFTGAGSGSGISIIKPWSTAKYTEHWRLQFLTGPAARVGVSSWSNHCWFVDMVVVRVLIIVMWSVIEGRGAAKTPANVNMKSVNQRSKRGGLKIYAAKSTTTQHAPSCPFLVQQNNLGVIPNLHVRPRWTLP